MPNFYVVDQLAGQVTKRVAFFKMIKHILTHGSRRHDMIDQILSNTKKQSVDTV